MENSEHPVLCTGSRIEYCDCIYPNNLCDQQFAEGRNEYADTPVGLRMAVSDEQEPGLEEERGVAE